MKETNQPMRAKRSRINCVSPINENRNLYPEKSAKHQANPEQNYKRKNFSTNAKYTCVFQINKRATLARASVTDDPNRTVETTFLAQF